MRIIRRSLIAAALVSIAMVCAIAPWRDALWPSLLLVMIAALVFLLARLLDGPSFTQPPPHSTLVSAARVATRILCGILALPALLNFANSAFWSIASLFDPGSRIDALAFLPPACFWGLVTATLIHLAAKRARAPDAQLPLPA